METLLGLKQSALAAGEHGGWLLLAFALGVAAGWVSAGRHAAESGGAG